MEEQIADDRHTPQAEEECILRGVVDSDGTTVSVYLAHKTMAEETDNCLEDLLPAKVMSRSELDSESDVIALARWAAGPVPHGPTAAPSPWACH
jgi:type 1 glutamine amidotransferase